jgi:hypothetical protein
MPSADIRGEPQLRCPAPLCRTTGRRASASLGPGANGTAGSTAGYKQNKGHACHGGNSESAHIHNDAMCEHASLLTRTVGPA